MFTACPNCHTVYRVRAPQLSAAKPMARCRRCHATFDALANLRDAPPARPAERPEPQLPTLELGDRTILRPSAVTRFIPGAPAESKASQAAAGQEPAVPRRGSPNSVAGTAPSPTASASAISQRLEAVPSRVDTPPARLIRLPLSLRNLLRNRQRTFFTLGAISFGLIALILAGGFIEWIFWAMREAAIQGRVGHLQVTQAGYRTEGAADPFAFLLPEESADRERIAKLPHVRLLAPRLNFTGLISREEVTVPFIADGVDPAKEAELSVDFRIGIGDNLDPNDPAGVIVGAGLASAIGIQPGDKVTLLSTTGSGGLGGVEVHVRGLFYTSNKVWNDSALRVPIGLAQSLLRVSGAHTWVILLDNTENTGAVLDELRAERLDANHNLEFTPWYMMADFYRKTVALFSRQMQVVKLVIGVIFLLGISNTLMMSVAERTGEIGTLLALGLRRRDVLRLFLAEGFLLGMSGGVLGTGLGSVIAAGVSVIGIPMPPAPGMDTGYTAEILVTSGLIAGAFVLAVTTATAASFYPAWKASRLAITDALRRNV